MTKKDAELLDFINFVNNNFIGIVDVASDGSLFWKKRFTKHSLLYRNEDVIKEYKYHKKQKNGNPERKRGIS